MRINKVLKVVASLMCVMAFMSAPLVSLAGEAPKMGWVDITVNMPEEATQTVIVKLASKDKQLVSLNVSYINAYRQIQKIGAGEYVVDSIVVYEAPEDFYTITASAETLEVKASETQAASLVIDCTLNEEAKRILSGEPVVIETGNLPVDNTITPEAIGKAESDENRGQESSLPIEEDGEAKEETGKSIGVMKIILTAIILLLVLGVVVIVGIAIRNRMDD